MRSAWIFLLIVGVTVLLCVGTAKGSSVPALRTHVNDYAELLSPACVKQVAASLAAYQKSTTNQIVVLTVNSTGGEAISEYANTVFSVWRLGTKEKDNGVLVLITKTGARIEVGRGLEYTLPDAVVQKMLREQLVPSFRLKKYDEGVIKLVRQLQLTIKK